MSWSDAVAQMAVMDGLLAQRKLDGDTTIYAPDDPQVLQAIVSQGKRAEGILRRTKDGIFYLRRAYEHAGVPFFHADPSGETDGAPNDSNLNDA